MIWTQFIEELNPFDGIQDVAKQKGRKPPALPARRKDSTNVLLDMTPFFWNQLEACWEGPSMRPKTYEVVNNLQTLATRFTPAQSEQIESPPPYTKSTPENKAGANFGSPDSIPPQPPVQVSVSIGNALSLAADVFTPTRQPTPTRRPTPGAYDSGSGDFVMRYDDGHPASEDRSRAPLAPPKIAAESTPADSVPAATRDPTHASPSLPSPVPPIKTPPAATPKSANAGTPPKAPGSPRAPKPPKAAKQEAGCWDSFVEFICCYCCCGHCCGYC
jgi:hypothetical protein